MIAADQIRATIFMVGRRHGQYNPFPLSDVAKELDLLNWEELMESVNLVAEVLILQGHLEKKGDQVMLVVGEKQT
jgi:hypothetical protein